MIWSIILEIVTGFIILAIGNVFWSCIKSPKYLGRILSNYKELFDYVNFIGRKKLIEYAVNVEKLDNEIVSYEDVIRFRILSSIKAVDKTRNLMVFLLIIILGCSYFLGWMYILINITLFLIIGLKGISISAQNNVFNDIQVIILNIYRWYQIDNEKCKMFCNEIKPRFSNIYRIVTNELID